MCARLQMQTGARTHTRTCTCTCERVFEPCSRLHRASDISPPPTHFSFSCIVPRLLCASVVHSTCAGTGALVSPLPAFSLRFFLSFFDHPFAPRRPLPTPFPSGRRFVLFPLPQLPHRDPLRLCRRLQLCSRREADPSRVPHVFQPRLRARGPALRTSERRLRAFWATRVRSTARARARTARLFCRAVPRNAHQQCRSGTGRDDDGCVFFIDACRVHSKEHPRDPQTRPNPLRSQLFPPVVDLAYAKQEPSGALSAGSAGGRAAAARTGHPGEGKKKTGGVETEVETAGQRQKKRKRRCRAVCMRVENKVEKQRVIGKGASEDEKASGMGGEAQTSGWSRLVAAI